MIKRVTRRYLCIPSVSLSNLELLKHIIFWADGAFNQEFSDPIIIINLKAKRNIIFCLHHVPVS